ncbi:hypothetical protein [Rothia terrae]|uniref:Uncharacterized protein n=1 Tax=Rothia terrae TaxID=396015 RepID=A0A7H2BDN0_9MICC|nr:hypothetical protein [Rothia terrae]MDT0190592.1 hypothetical protein [Rothia terrae]QNV37776.1 hypothetical protein IDM49_00180 [Rothia terrae]
MSENLEVSDDAPVRKTWRSWFTTGRIFVLSLCLVVAVILASCAVQAAQEAQREAEYKARSEREQAAYASAVAADPINFYGAPEGFEKLVDRKFFDELAVEKMRVSQRSNGDSWKVTAIPSQAAIDDSQGFAEQMKKLAEAQEIEEILLYSSSGSELTLNPTRLMDLSPSTWRPLVSVLRSERSYDLELTEEGVLTGVVHRGGNHGESDVVGRSEVYDALRQLAQVPLGQGVASTSMNAAYVVEQPDGAVISVVMDSMAADRAEDVRRAEETLTGRDWSVSAYNINFFLRQQSSPRDSSLDEFEVGISLYSEGRDSVPQEELASLESQVKADLGENTSFDVSADSDGTGNATAQAIYPSEGAVDSSAG